MNKPNMQNFTMALLVIIPLLTICVGFLASLYSYNETVFTFLGGAVVGFATSQASRYARWVSGSPADEDTTKPTVPPKV